MKHIVKLAPNRYVHLDTYGEPQQGNLLTNVLLTFMVLFIATITTSAMLGIDITNFKPSIYQEKLKWLLM